MENQGIEKPLPTQLASLDETILQRVFQHLNWTELNTIRFLCGHFNKIVPLQYARIFRKYRIAGKVNMDKLTATLQHVGHHINDLFIDTEHLGHHAETLGHLVLTHCPHLTHLHVQYADLFNFATKSVANKLNRLQALSLGFFRTQATDDLIMQYLSQCCAKTLRSLSLDNMFHLTGGCLMHENARHLNELVLRDNFRLSLDDVHRYTMTNGHLHKLELTYILTPARSMPIAKLCSHLPQVQHLVFDMTFSEAESHAIQLHNLQHLEVTTENPEAVFDLLPSDTRLRSLRLFRSLPLARDSLAVFGKLKKLQTLIVVPQWEFGEMEMTEMCGHFRELDSLIDFQLKMGKANYVSLVSNMPHLRRLSLTGIVRFGEDLADIGRLEQLIQLRLELMPNAWANNEECHLNRLFVNLAKRNRLQSLTFHCANEIRFCAATVDRFMSFDSLRWLSFRPSGHNADFLNAICVPVLSGLRHLQLLYGTDAFLNRENLGNWIRGLSGMQSLELGVPSGKVDTATMVMLWNARPDLRIDIISVESNYEYDMSLRQYCGGWPEPGV